MEIFDMEYFLNYITRDNPFIKAIRPQSINVPSPAAPIKKGVEKTVQIFDLGQAMSPFIRIAGISGALAVGLGAYGAHKSYPKEREDELKQIFNTASRYHFIHTLALVAVPHVRYPLLTGSLLLTGKLLFCGPCYHHAFTGKESVMNKVVPFGGVIFIIAWLTMAL